MQPETAQWLGSLECLLENKLWISFPWHEEGGTLQPYVWDAEVHNTLTVLHLLQVEGWMQATDLEVALQDWQWPEQQGSAAPGMFVFDPQFCLQDDPENILLDGETQSERSQIYQTLQTLLKTELQDVQAFKLSCCPDYSLSIVMGKTAGNLWLGLAAIVPQETPFKMFEQDGIRRLDFHFVDGEGELKYSVLPDLAIATPKQEAGAIDPTLAQIQALLSQLEPIRIYGWYDGGYRHTHNYGIICASGKEYEQVFELTLKTAGLFQLHQFQGFDFETAPNNKNDEDRQMFQQLNRFLNRTLSNIKLYRFCFWDYEHIYVLGQSRENDRVGIVVRSQFFYNP